MSGRKRKVLASEDTTQPLVTHSDCATLLQKTHGTSTPQSWVLCYCDTETTDLKDAYVVQFALVCYDLEGKVLLEVNRLCKPRGKISAGATNIHHITDAHVQEAPLLSTVLAYTAEQLDLVCEPGARRVLVTYNGDAFDIPAIVRHLSWENTANSPESIFEQLRFHASVDLLLCLPQLDLTLTPTFTRTGRVNTDPTRVKLTVLYEQVLRRSLDGELAAHDARDDCLILKAIVHHSSVFPKVLRCLETTTVGITHNLLQVIRQLGRSSTCPLPGLLTIIPSTSKRGCISKN